MNLFQSLLVHFNWSLCFPLFLHLLILSVTFVGFFCLVGCCLFLYHYPPRNKMVFKLSLIFIGMGDNLSFNKKYIVPMGLVQGGCLRAVEGSVLHILTPQNSILTLGCPKDHFQAERGRRKGRQLPPACRGQGQRQGRAGPAAPTTAWQICLKYDLKYFCWGTQEKRERHQEQRGLV